MYDKIHYKLKNKKRKKNKLDGDLVEKKKKESEKEWIYVCV